MPTVRVYGFRGVPGPQGETGPQGATGAAGANGTNGTDGLAATISVGATTTGAPGADAQVTNSGTTSAAVFDFTIPRGVAGTGGDIGTAQLISGHIALSTVYVNLAPFYRHDITAVVSASTKALTSFGVVSLIAGSVTFSGVTVYTGGAFVPVIVSVDGAGALFIGNDIPSGNSAIGVMRFTSQGSWASGNFYTITPTPYAYIDSYQRYNNVWNVKDFGAVGDGSTDDTAAIQAAITYLRAQFAIAFPKVDAYGAPTTLNFNLLFPNGTYLITASLLNYLGICFIGESQKDTILLGVDNAVDKNPSLHLVTVYGVAGNRAPYRCVRDITFKDVILEMGNIYISNADDWEGTSEFIDCTFTSDTYESGSTYWLKCYGSNVDYSVKNCTFDIPKTFTHLYAYGVKSITVEGCEFYGGSVHALYGENIHEARIADNKFIATTDYGWGANAIFVPSSRFWINENIVIDNNVIEGAHEEAIGLDGLGNNLSAIPNICNGSLTSLVKQAMDKTSQFTEDAPFKITMEMNFLTATATAPYLSVLDQDSTVVNTATDWITLGPNTAALKPGMTVRIKSGTAGSSTINGSSTGTAVILESSAWVGSGLYGDRPVAVGGVFPLQSTSIRIDQVADLKSGTTLELYGWATYNVSDRDDWTTYYFTFDEDTGVDGLVTKITAFDPVAETLTIDSRLPAASFTGTGRVGIQSGFFNCSITNNTIRNCHATSSAHIAVGISVYLGMFGVKVTNNRIIDCDAGINMMGGVMLSQNIPLQYFRLLSYNNTIANNTVIGTRRSSSYVSGAIVASSQYASTGAPLYQHGNVIANNTVIGEGDVIIGWQDGVVVTGNEVSGGGNILLRYSKDFEVSGNNVRGNSAVILQYCANTLPSPSAQYLGKTFWLITDDGSGTPTDLTYYVCKVISDVYTWAEL